MRRIPRKRLNGMAFLVWFGWHYVLRRYWCLSVGFVWRSVLMRWTWTSRKGSVWRRELEYSWVNLMLGWIEFRKPMKDFRCSFPCVQIMKISSMNLHQINDLSKELSMACCSNLLMNELAYEGAMRVPIAVPCFCKKCSLLKEKLFIVRIILMRSQMFSAGSD